MEVCAVEIRALEVYTGQVRVGEERALKLCVAEARMVQIRVREVDGTAIGNVTVGYDRQGGLDIARQKAGFFDSSPANPVTDKCRQYGHDGRLVRGRVFHDALQCVDAAKSNIHRGGAEVGDGSEVPVGDLSLLGDPELGACCPYCQECED